MHSPFAFILFILCGCVIAWCFLSPKPALRLIVSKAKILKHSGFKRNQISQAEEFFEKQFADKQLIKIAAFPGPYGKFKFKITGELDPGEVQQIRNFLVDIT